jgi:signal transduction histidine kinase
MVLLLGVFLFQARATSVSDSLLARLHTEQNDSLRCILFSDICFQLCYSYPDSALRYGRQALDIAFDLESTYLKGATYNRIGIVYDIMSDWDTSLLCYNQAAYYGILCSDTVTIASAYNNMGLIYWNKVQYDQAIDYYLRSLGLFEKIGKTKGVANTFNNISLIYWEQGELMTAIEYQYKSLALRKEIADDYGIGASYVNLGMLYSEIDSLHQSKVFLYDGIDVKLKHGDDAHGLAIAYNDLALTLHALGQDDSAILCYQKAIELHLGNENDHGAASTYLNLGELYRARGEKMAAQKTLIMARDLEQKSGGSKTLVTIYHALAESFSSTGNHTEASRHYDLHIALKDSLYNVETYEKLLEVEKRYETEKKDREIEELKNIQAEKDLASAEDQLKIATRNKWLAILGLGMMAIVFVSLYVLLRIRSGNELEKNRILVESKEQSLRAIFEATEKERQRIAKDLHDGIGQQLSGLKLAWSKVSGDLEAIQPEHAKKLNQLTRILDESATELREISHQMMPRVLSEMGLIPALEDVLDKSLALGDIEYSFDYYNLDERLPQRIEITLFRVAQELLNNIIKHAGAKKVNVQLFRNQHHVILIIEDDGKGLGSNFRSEGHGFMNIKSRLDVVNGTFNLEPSFTSGTVATIRISLT